MILRRASKHYANTPKGRENHSQRQRRYRERQKSETYRTSMKSYEHVKAQSFAMKTLIMESLVCCYVCGRKCGDVGSERWGYGGKRRPWSTPDI